MNDDECKTTKSEWTPPPGVTADVLYGYPHGPVMIARVRLAPGAEVPREVHDTQTEEVILAVGSVEIAIWGKWRLIDCLGDSFSIPPGCEHIITNPSSVQLAEYVAVMTRR